MVFPSSLIPLKGAASPKQLQIIDPPYTHPNHYPRHKRGFLLHHHSPEIHQKHPSPSLVTLLLFTTTQVIVKESRGIPLRDITLKQTSSTENNNEHSNFRSSSRLHSNHRRGTDGSQWRYGLGHFCFLGGKYRNWWSSDDYRGNIKRLDNALGAVS